MDHKTGPVCPPDGAASTAARDGLKATGVKRDGLWFEDFIPGRRFPTASATSSEAQILDFAWAHDPQPFRLDKEAAAASP